MTVRELIEALENFDEDMEVRIGMRQKYGTDFAMRIADDIEEYEINSFWGKDYKAVVITEGSQCGSVEYDEDYRDDDWY